MAVDKIYRPLDAACKHVSSVFWGTNSTHGLLHLKHTLFFTMVTGLLEQSVWLMAASCSLFVCHIGLALNPCRANRLHEINRA